LKNTIKFIFFILGSLFLLPSCGNFLEDVDVKGDDQIAVVGYISPNDSLVQIALFRAIGIGSGKDENSVDYIQNAIVRISDGQNSYVMNYGTNPYAIEDLGTSVGGNPITSIRFDKPQFTYQIENAILNISEGKTYFIEIETDKGEKLSANCTVPVGKVFPTVVLTKFNEQEYSYKAEWEDDLSTTNYYRLEAYQTSFTVGYDSNTGGPIAIFKQTGTTYFYDNYFKTQEGRQTINYKPEGRVYFYESSIPNFPNVPTPKPYVTTYLMKTDENYYRYHKSVEKAYNNEGNPFGEPIIIHSNIENGIGCFGAYISSETITERE